MKSVWDGAAVGYATITVTMDRDPANFPTIRFLMDTEDEVLIGTESRILGTHNNELWEKLVFLVFGCIGKYGFDLLILDSHWQTQLYLAPDIVLPLQWHNYF